MEAFDFVKIAYVILAMVSVVITKILIPYIKEKTNAEDIANTLAMVEIAVKAAEQIYNKAGQGRLKKEYVVQYLNDRGIKVDERDLDNMIEATVLELNKWKKELEAQPVVTVNVDKSVEA